MKKKVIVGLSGGVDSSSTAYLLQKAGYEVMGCSIWMTEYNNFDDADKVARTLGIKYKIMDKRDLFKQEVENYFFETYKLGLTPNPCVQCNKHVKFKTLFDVMISEDADFIATGHYAKIYNSKLMVAYDKTKDQSYFLYGIPKHYLAKIIFPLGDYLKSEIKELSKNFSDTLAKKDESQDICFLKSDYKKHFSPCCGKIVNDKNEILGQHNGIFNYTVGQRKGLGIAYSEPLFVKEINSEENKIIVSTKEGAQADKFEIVSVNILDENLLERNDEIDGYKFKITNVDVKVRYASIKKKGDVYISEDLQSSIIHLRESEIGIAKGQSAVIYVGDQVVLGGIINKIFY